jgi:hypothetical protein
MPLPQITIENDGVAQIVDDEASAGAELLGLLRQCEQKARDIGRHGLADAIDDAIHDDDLADHIRCLVTALNSDDRA